ncbi:MAG: hypothetical protein DWI05_03345 [Planctomycetota bacterium]|nr:MAG: hypothetical protein DWI05_03345 [Planctomycetota bacterium]
MHDRSTAAADAAQASSREKTLRGAVILLAVLALLAGGAIAHGGPSRAGGAEWQRAVAVVAGVCGASSLGGWFVARLGAGGAALAVSGSLGGIVLRLVLPLLLLGWLSVDPATAPGAGRLREAGAGGLLVVFYLTLLATDILLHIMWGPKGPLRPQPGA